MNKNFPSVSGAGLPRLPGSGGVKGTGASAGAGTERAAARVLVVEDEFVIALDLQVLLYRFGHDVLGPVGSVAEALVVLRHERPDAAVLDINLRDGLVFPVAERLADMGVPFVLVTARDTRHLTHPLLDAAPTLSKPVDDEELRREIGSLLARPEAGRG